LASFPEQPMATINNATSFSFKADFTVVPSRIGILLSDPRICEPRMRQLPILPEESSAVFQLRCADVCRYSPEKFRHES
jgi:hypothetical protein